MRRPRYLDMVCPACESRHERFCETNDDGTPVEPETCDVNMMNYDGVCCDGVLVVEEFYSSPLMAPLAGTNRKTNPEDAARQHERLVKRSNEHFHKKGGRDEAIERERAVLKKNGMEGAGGVW